MDLGDLDAGLNTMNLKNKAASSAVSACGEESSGTVQYGDAKLASVKQEVAGLCRNV